ncbi:MAG: hypothetical protein EOM17_15380, partial [Synergistales bacterium]|nr:hypothetical protein [Synergistales bacterium]
MEPVEVENFPLRGKAKNERVLFGGCGKFTTGYPAVPENLPEQGKLIGRRNLSKEDRDALIRRLAAAGVPQRKIAATAKCSQGTVSNIANKMIKNDHSPTIKSTSAAEELGARRTNADKRRAVEMAFRWLIEEERSVESITNVEVAKMASVNEKIVRRLRDEIVLELDANSAKPKATGITNSELTTTQRLKDELA